MLFGARAFVFLVYVLFGASFIAGTALLFWEFGPEQGLLFATHDSHLFLFFPTLGLVALAAFYLPSCAFVDMYWRHVSLGKARLFLGLVALSAISFQVGTSIAASPYRSIWDLSPETLLGDRSEPAGCGSSGKPCERMALLDAIQNVAEVSHRRLGLKDFITTCAIDPLVEAPPQSERRKFCFASTPLPAASALPRMSTDQECCRAQERFKETVRRLYSDTDAHSITGEALKLLLPVKVLFLLVLLAISGLLALRHRGVERHYPGEIERIEAGVLAGAIAMVFFPLLSQGFVQSADALFGPSQDQGFRPMVPVMSFCFGAWALLLLLFFFKRHNTQMEMAAKLAGVAASGIAVVKYDLIVALVVRFLGSGAGLTSIILIAILTLISIAIMTSALVRRMLSGDTGIDDKT